MVQSRRPVLKSILSCAREGAAPCFSSLSRCLNVMTASRLFSPGSMPGLFLSDRRFVHRIIGCMTSLYLWVKAFHIVFVASWFAGLFYLPRFFINLVSVPADSHAERERLLLMARRLYRFSTVLMVPALALGLWLWLGFGLWHGPGHGWLHAKLFLVVGAVGYHHACRVMMRRFEQMANRRSERWFRVFNEVTVLLFAAIVVLVVVKPF
jgi:protoporphyrinogen IX oxidase